eukprot:9113683-Lingulodinium_polyedra.AAC.1
MLAAREVRPTTQGLYLGVAKLLLRWRCLGLPPAWPRKHWGATLGEFVDWVFDQGFSQASPNRVGPAFFWAEPRLRAGA